MTPFRKWSISPFFNEVDVLEVKVREQMAWVDVFVFAESDRTYAGTPRDRLLRTWLDTTDRGRQLVNDAAAYNAEIRVVEHDGSKLYPTPFQGFGDPTRWAREQAQRAALLDGMQDLGENDVVCLSDLDEIVRGSLIGGYSAEGWDMVCVPPLTMHVGSLTTRWSFPLHVIARLYRGGSMFDCGDPTYYHGHCNEDPETVRRMPGMRLELPPGQDMSYYGWHLSWMGGPDAMRFKLREAAHPEMDAPHLHEDAHLERVRLGEVDLFERDGRSGVPCPRYGLPRVIAEDFEVWRQRLEGPGVQDPV